MPTEHLADIAAFSPCAAVNEREIRVARISRVMRLLPETYAELLEEKYFDGSRVREMAQRRRQSEVAVESALARARAAFRALWQREYGEELNGSWLKRSTTHER